MDPSVPDTTEQAQHKEGLQYEEDRELSPSVSKDDIENEQLKEGGEDDVRPEAEQLLTDLEGTPIHHAESTDYVAAADEAPISSNKVPISADEASSPAEAAVSADEVPEAEPINEGAEDAQKVAVERAAAASKFPKQPIDETSIYSMRSHKELSGDVTRKKKLRKSAKEGPAPSIEAKMPVQTEKYDDLIDYANEDPTTRKRRFLEEKMDMAVKSKVSKRRKADEDDLERLQDDRIDALKNKMIEAANLDVEKNSQGQLAFEKFKLLRQVMDILSKADLVISILDNNLLEAVRLWLEPLPDASMPLYQIQKELLHALITLPIKTDHLVASGLGKVLVFYQRSKRTEPSLKKIVDKLIGEWTRPILNKSDSYKDRTIKFNDYNKAKYTNQLSSMKKNKVAEPKTLYEQQAERRNRAAIPSARTTAYKIAPKVDPSLLMRQQRGGEMFNRITRKMINSRKKVVKKSGPSIEGKNLSL